MRVMVLVKATQSSENGLFPEPWTTDMMAAMGRFMSAGNMSWSIIKLQPG